MNILKNLRKPYLSVFLAFLMATLFLTISCSQSDSVENMESQLELKDFINSNLAKSNINMNVSKVKQYELKSYKSLKQNVGISAKNSDEFQPYSIEIVADNETYNLHTIPTSETHASIIIETSDGQFNEVIEVDISDYDSVNDEYKISWSINNQNKPYASKDYDPNDCRTGAATVAAVGRVIAFGSFFGCVPCAFVGGAITALGSLGYIGCVANGE
jgi:hypothetical protein